MSRLIKTGYAMSRWTVGDVGQWNNYGSQQFDVDDYAFACDVCDDWKAIGYHVRLETTYTIG